MKPYIWALLSALIWGCAPILEKLGLTKISVFPGVFYRSLGVILGLIFLFAFKYSEIKSSFPGISHHWIYLILSGFLASIVGQIFFYHALRGGEASQVVPLAGTYPLVSFIIGVLFLGEQLSFGKVSGVALVVMGVMLLK